MAAYRYWRIQITATQLEDYTDCKEIELRGEVDGDDLTDSGGSVIYSSQENGTTYAAANAFDNNASTAWVSDIAETMPQWIGWDFGASNEQEIVEISYTSWNADDAPYSWQIDVSSNGTDWTPYDALPDQSAWSPSETRVLSVSSELGFFHPPVLSLSLSTPTPDYSPHSFYPQPLSLPLSIQSADYSPHSFYPSALSLPLAFLQVPTLYYVPNLSLSLSYLAPSREARISIPNLSLGLAVNPIAITLDPLSGIKIYRLILTGDGDATTDVELPLANFSGRLRDAEESYLQAVIPDAYSYADLIADRPNGDIVISSGVRFADGTTQFVEIARANLESIADDRGSRSASVTLSGHKQSTNQAPKSRDMSGVTYRHGGSGTKRYRCTLDPNLRPGDTAVFPNLGESIIVGTIQYIVDPRREEMELTELE